MGTKGEDLIHSGKASRKELGKSYPFLKDEKGVLGRGNGMRKGLVASSANGYVKNVIGRGNSQGVNSRRGGCLG